MIVAVALISNQSNTQNVFFTAATYGAPASQSVPFSQPTKTTSNPIQYDRPKPPVYAQSAYLLDADTGKELYSYNGDSSLPMLSTTKLMTALIAIERGNLDQKVYVNDTASYDISQLSSDSARMGIRSGETYTLRDLLYGLILVSGNDAADVIADALNGSIPSFVDSMNQHAVQMGLTHTHFVNPHGLLNQGQYASAHDLAVLGKAATANATLAKIMNTRSYIIKSPLHNLTNENQFLWWYTGADGGKTGFDGVNDFIQVIHATRNGHHLVGVVMHSINWWTDMRDLLNYGFNDFAWVSPRDVSKNHFIPYADLWSYFSSSQNGDFQDRTIPTSGGGRYYIATGYSVSGAIMNYFDQNGGLSKFGYPLSSPQKVQSTTVQKFERATITCDASNNVSYS